VYFEAKTMLASSTNIEPDELVDQIVEGITAQNLRDQARNQCFTHPMQILRAYPFGQFKGVGVKGAEQEQKRQRCGNCNARGQIAKYSRKPTWSQDPV